MKILTWQKLNPADQTKALLRPATTQDADLADKVRAVLDNVKKRGDQALLDYSKKFDKVELKDFRISQQAISASLTTIDTKLRTAIEQAKSNIEKFHEAEQPKPTKVETMPGVMCELQWRAIDTVGFYIPGGTAPLFSSVLMQAIPARLAGCKRMVLCTPPQKDGTIHPAILATASLCGISEIYAVGGAQAIAAMAYGTDTIPKADKIFGPGNAYVTMAKQLVSQDPNGAAIDLPAGPSEVMVIAESTARAQWVAADLLAQAEHDASAQAILVTTDEAFAKSVQSEVEKQLILLPRQDIAAKAIAESRILVVADMPMAIEVANRYAPEHLLIHNGDAARWLPEIRNAGSVFLGALTPESAGDYASGTNHVLPTYGYARAYNGITVLSFMKSMSVQSLSQQGLEKLGPTIIAMAEAEGLSAHAQAVKVRMGEQ
ncbi:MAG: histidinol dehydrogenase [Alphaproteobacteria bacterium]